MNNLRIIVTGGCGFIGSNYIRNTFLKNHVDILNIDNLSYAGNIETTKDFESLKNYTFVNGDIGDREILEKIIFDFKPNLILNFAAETHVDRSIDSSLQFIKTNINGTYNLLEVTRYYLKRNPNSNLKFIHISTDEVYGSLNEVGKFKESTPYDPSSPYSASKASSDHLVTSWNRTYNLPTIITNCSNNYGPYQYPEKLIPITIINALMGKKISIYGEGKQIRDWLHVNDHIAALNDLALKGKIGQTYNIGGENEIRNIEVVMKICSILDKYKPKDGNFSYKDQIEFVTDRPGHDYRYAVDISKIKNEISWSPKINFDEGLESVIKWYLDNFGWCKEVTSGKYDFERLGVY